MNHSNSDPLISIIIPAFNRANLIGETLDSVSKQTYTNWECIVVDDGSTDNTKEVVQGFIKKDARYRYADRPVNYKSGGNGARNYGFEISNGKYIQWLDSDDLLEPDKIEIQIKSLQQEPPSTVSFSRFNSFDSSTGKSVEIKYDFFRNYENPLDYIKKYCLRAKGFHTSSPIAPRNVTMKTGGWNEDLQINQDGDFIARLASCASKMVYSGDSVSLYRMNDAGKVRSDNSQKGIQYVQSLISTSGYINEHLNFEEQQKYCATLFINAKILFPDNKDIWALCDTEINNMGGRFFYDYGTRTFMSLWKVFGLRTALKYNDVKKRLNKLR